MRAASLSIAVTLAVLVPACTRTDVDRTESGAPRAPAGSPGDASTVDARDQYALLAAIETARGSGLRGDPGALASVTSDWNAHRVTWELGFVAPLCPADGPGPCVVMPFDHAHRTAPIVQGWLPVLDVDDTARDGIAADCAGRRRCVIEVEATITDLVLSTEEPTSLTLSDVQVVGTRDASPGESWVRRS